MGNSSRSRDRSTSRSRSRNLTHSHSLHRNRRVVPEENVRDTAENRDRDTRNSQCRREQYRIEVTKERKEGETEQDKASSSTMPFSSFSVYFIKLSIRLTTAHTQMFIYPPSPPQGGDGFDHCIYRLKI
jgi:hypothetical protein